jgi:hypothetical protein
MELPALPISEMEAVFPEQDCIPRAASSESLLVVHFGGLTIK